MAEEEQSISWGFQSEVATPNRRYNEIFTQLAEHLEYIPLEGPHGIYALQAQFRGTVIADVFDDLPEDTPVSVHKLDFMIISRLIHARNQVLVSQDKVRRREMSMQHDPSLVAGSEPDYYKFIEDNRHAGPILAGAEDVRGTVLSLVPEMKLGHPDELSIEFTPLLKGQQIVLLQRRSQRFKAPAAASSTILALDETQYTVFTKNVHSIWEERGTLTFSDYAEYDQDPDQTREVTEEELEDLEYSEFPYTNVKIAPTPIRDSSIHREVSYPVAYFNPDAETTYADAYASHVYRTIFAPLTLDAAWRE